MSEGVGLVSRREVEREFGSLEELAFWLLVENPGVLEGGVDAVVGVSGLSRRVVAWLLRESDEFQGLLDSHVAGGVWGVGERRVAYEVLRERVVSGRDRLGDSVRAMEYLDGKVGLSMGVRGQPQVAVQIVQEGDRSWESDYEGLEFGGEASSESGAVEVLDVEFE